MCEENKTDAAYPVQTAYDSAEIRRRPTPLRERVARARRRASDRSAAEHEDVLRLLELNKLLDDNPAVARILELLEATGV